MAIIQLSNNEKLPTYMQCAICGKYITPTEATVGLLDTENQQQFCCNGHFWSPHQFITGWADFMAAERTAQTRTQFVAEYGGVVNARLMY